LASRTLYRAGGAVTLVGGGPVAPADLAAALALAPEAVAADGGGDHALPPGHAFRAVIGDMDSLRGREGLAGVPVHAIPEQETTDLEKCLYSVEAPLFVGLGFLGGRIDHHLAAMNALAKNPDKRVVLVGGGELCFLCPRRFEIDLAAGTKVSLFPMAEVRGLEWEGLRWPLAGSFRPDGRIGTSNLALGGRVRMAFDAPRMLAILPAALLGPVAERLRGARELSSPPAR
jgi:thiamine pyrophosphokinase